MRVDGRASDQIREVSIETNFVKHPEGSVLISMGDTRVICTATVEDRVPPFLRGQGKGWIAAEYAMLPRATETRNIRESSKGKVSGRTMEIQRLIGRSLRSVINLEKIGERTVWIDCDVIQADGGTRTASITGAFVALALAMDKVMSKGKIKDWPIQDYLAAISVGVESKKGELLDLCYVEDASAEVDMNVVMTGKHEFVELQGTGEEATFSRPQLNKLLDLAEIGIDALILKQKEALGDIAARMKS
ncbi:ribonuclease PH [Halalkalibacter alkaliphilus]|uniref:Ribonuclease PH n=1 Tax=Halalkalibacter alkaliphilus TaxID=2917993 RepID=A0A9X2CTJ0_9BACI|nr:ribonuclease PH [Halalkalibacter alkaliphilus]MCL7748061.1 ribonuclease PH [Halalkalibacter alkaliphilus]